MCRILHPNSGGVPRLFSLPPGQPRCKFIFFNYLQASAKPTDKLTGFGCASAWLEATKEAADKQ
jgi:hypothetical protein